VQNANSKSSKNLSPLYSQKIAVSIYKNWVFTSSAQFPPSENTTFDDWVQISIFSSLIRLIKRTAEAVLFAQVHPDFISFDKVSRRAWRETLQFMV
jgi:hypothetical protein